MAATSKGKKWERQNSRFMFLAFAPLVGFMPFIIMGNNVHSKRYKITGYVILAILVLFLAAQFVLPTLNNPYMAKHTAAVQAEPNVNDYYSYDDYLNDPDKEEFYYSSAKYKEYVKDYNDYWAQDENANLKNQYLNFSNTVRSLTDFSAFAVFALYWICIILVFSERSRYLKMLAQDENRERIVDVFSAKGSAAASGQQTHPAERIISDEPIRDVPVPPTDAVDRIDINTATEEEIAAIKGLTLIDAKKAVAYRTEHGGFRNTDEFFDAIGAKPHIIAHLDGVVFASQVKAKQPPSLHRHIDF